MRRDVIPFTRFRPIYTTYSTRLSDPMPRDFVCRHGSMILCENMCSKHLDVSNERNTVSLAHKSKGPGECRHGVAQATGSVLSLNVIT